jgi:pSer/pThr/pTyr-binding forkhead associated (FHA) protein
LRDLKSTNGTYVNDKRVEKHELVDSDFVRLGNSVLKFKSL